jgi:hypothetical protein
VESRPMRTRVEILVYAIVMSKGAARQMPLTCPRLPTFRAIPARYLAEVGTISRCAAEPELQSNAEAAGSPGGGSFYRYRFEREILSALESRQVIGLEFGCREYLLLTGDEGNGEGPRYGVPVEPSDCCVRHRPGRSCRWAKILREPGFLRELLAQLRWPRRSPPENLSRIRAASFLLQAARHLHCL